MTEASVTPIGDHLRFNRRESDARHERREADAQAETTCAEAIEKGYSFATVRPAAQQSGLENSILFSKSAAASAIDIAKAGTDASETKAVITDVVAKYRETIPVWVRDTGVFKVFRQSAYFKHGDQLLPEEDLLRRWQNVAVRLKNLKESRARIYVADNDIYVFPLHRRLTGELKEHAHQLDAEMTERLYPVFFLRSLKDEMLARQGETALPREETLPKDEVLTVQECFEGNYRLRREDELMVPEGVPVEDTETGEFSLLDSDTRFSVVRIEGYDIRLKSADDKWWCTLQFDDRNSRVRYQTT